MRVHWKRLCSLGILFWAGMSAYDYYYGSILVPGEFSKTGQNDWLVDVQSQSKMMPPAQIDKTESSGWSYYGYILTSLTSITLFAIVYLTVKYYPKYNIPSATYSKEIIATNEVIRAALFDGGCKSLDPSCENILIIQENKFDMCPANRFRMKEENTESALSREMLTLNKRIDVLNEEKRNLTRFLAQSEKDNRIIKQKMMEVLRDKNVLLKKLEAATREIRTNTVARQATLDKLEESIQCSNQLKQQVQQISTDRAELLRRLRQMEAQCKTLKRQQDNQSITNKSSNNGVRLSNARSIDSNKDIEQIEMKLHDLEVSLEKMKCRNAESTEEFESEDNDDTCDLSEPKILRQVSSSDMNFLSEVEPSFTNLLDNYECESSSGQLHQQIVESIAPAVSPYCELHNKFVVPPTFGSTLFNMLTLIQKQPAESINGMVRPRDPVVVNYGVVCNFKYPYADQLAMLGGNYFGKRTLSEEGVGKKNDIWCQELVKYVQLPNNFMYH